MTRIIIDSSLREKLLDLASPLELCDDEGRVLTHVTPANGSPEYDPSDPQISAEELRRRATSNEKRYTTSQVLNRLDSL